MNVVVEIAGREAIPVWTIPYVTSWDIHAESLLEKLQGIRHYNDPPLPVAFNLDSKGTPHNIFPESWGESASLLRKLEDDLRSQNLPKVEEHEQWRTRSIEIIMKQRGCYIRLDEFLSNEHEIN